MLGKMLKYEWKATWRMLTLLNVTTIIFSLIGRIGLEAKGLIPSFVIAIYVGFYIFLLVASALITLIYLIVRFYKNLYTSQGYLTNTLPVSTACLLNGKILNCVIWMFINLICIMVSLAVFTIHLTPSHELSELLHDWMTAIGLMMGTRSSVITIVYLVFYLITGTLNSILMLYFSVSIGCSFNTHRVLASVVTCLLTYIVVQTLGTFLLMFTGFFTRLGEWTLLRQETMTPESLIYIYNNVFIASFFLSIALSVVYYLVCHYMLSKKLNLG